LLGFLSGVDRQHVSLGSGGGRVVFLRVRVMRDLTATAPCAAHLFASRDGALTRCISIADASLSLSLSLAGIF
jgi:hypothetical protein